MNALHFSIDMRQLPNCGAEEILVQRSGEHLFWCAASKGKQRLDLGPVILDFAGKLTQQWHPQYQAVIGGQENLNAFFQALEGFLRQRQVIA